MPDTRLSPKALLGLASLTAGVILVVLFWESRVFWFQGGPLGLALIGLGGLDLWESRRHARSGAPRGPLQELRDEWVGSPRRPERRRDGVPIPPREPGASGVEDAGLEGRDR